MAGIETPFQVFYSLVIVAFNPVVGVVVIPFIECVFERVQGSSITTLLISFEGVIECREGVVAPEDASCGATFPFRMGDLELQRPPGSGDRRWSGTGGTIEKLAKKKAPVIGVVDGASGVGTCQTPAGIHRVGFL